LHQEPELIDLVLVVGCASREGAQPYATEDAWGCFCVLLCITAAKDSPGVFLLEEKHPSHCSLGRSVRLFLSHVFLTYLPIRARYITSTPTEIFFHCCMRILCRGNVFTQPLRRKGPAILSYFRHTVLVTAQQQWRIKWYSVLLESSSIYLADPYISRSYGTYRLIDRLCGLVLRVSGYRSRGSGFDSRPYQIFWEVGGLERGPLSFVRTIEELLEWKK
jgi:hypothetical protein